MKSVLMALVATTALSAFTSLAQAQSITFDQAPDVASPLEITIIRSEIIRAGVYYLWDSGSSVRFILASRSESGSQNVPNVQIYNSAQVQISSQDLAADEKSHLILLTSRASRSCPVKILVNRETRKIERVSPTCDELAELPPDTHNG